MNYNFESFINEKNINAETILTITEKNFELDVSGKHFTVIRIEEECKKLNLKNYIIFIDSFLIKKIETNKIEMLIYDKDNNEKLINFNPEKTIAIIRGTLTTNLTGKSLLTFLKQNNIKLYNDIDLIDLCGNKYLTYLKLNQNKILQPKTILITHNKSIEEALKLIGNKFPVIIKTVSGSQGLGVIKIESIENLRSTLQLLWQLETHIILQEYIENKFDIRTIYINGKFIAAMKRIHPKGDFRNNKSLGAEIEKYHPSEKELEFTKKISNILGDRGILGIDYFINKNIFYNIEVNSSPGMDGIEHITKLNIVKKFIQEFANIEE